MRFSAHAGAVGLREGAALVGARVVGARFGDAVGARVGLRDGNAVLGNAVGNFVVGNEEGNLVDGNAVGARVGKAVGNFVVGKPVGAFVDGAGVPVGASVVGASVSPSGAGGMLVASPHAASAAPSHPAATRPARTSSHVSEAPTAPARMPCTISHTASTPDADGQAHERISPANAWSDAAQLACGVPVVQITPGSSDGSLSTLMRVIGLETPQSSSKGMVGGCVRNSLSVGHCSRRRAIAAP